MKKLAKAAGVLAGVFGVQAPAEAACSGIETSQQEQVGDRVAKANAFLARFYDLTDDNRPRAVVYAVARCINSDVAAGLDGVDTETETRHLVDVLKGLGATRVKLQDGRLKTFIPDEAAAENPGVEELAEMLDDRLNR